MVAEGFFYLSNTLHITKAVELVGAGNGDLSLGAGPRRPATVLAFPANTTGIRIHSELRDDSPDGGSGGKAVIRDLMVVCTTPPPPDLPNVPKPARHGIHASAPISVENVNINYFWGNGINVVAKGDGGPEGGNADSSYFENCNAGLCGCDGFHFDGGTTGDAQACVISRCSGVVNRRAGFYDATFGNTYLGCHTEENTNQVPGNPNREKNARDYITEADANASVFITCWSKVAIYRTNSTVRSRLSGARLGRTPNT